MIVKRGIVTSVAEVQVLCDAGAERACLADVDPHAFVEAKDAVKIDGAGLGTEIARDKF